MQMRIHKAWLSFCLLGCSLNCANPNITARPVPTGPCAEDQQSVRIRETLSRCEVTIAGLREEVVQCRIMTEDLTAYLGDKMDSPTQATRHIIEENRVARDTLGNISEMAKAIQSEATIAETLDKKHSMVKDICQSLENRLDNPRSETVNRIYRAFIDFYADVLQFARVRRLITESQFARLRKFEDVNINGRKIDRDVFIKENCRPQPSKRQVTPPPPNGKVNGKA